MAANYLREVLWRTKTAGCDGGYRFTSVWLATQGHLRQHVHHGKDPLEA